MPDVRSSRHGFVKAASALTDVILLGETIGCKQQVISRPNETLCLPPAARILIMIFWTPRPP
jgi:hypothetical protein